MSRADVFSDAPRAPACDTREASPAPTAAFPPPLHPQSPYGADVHARFWAKVQWAPGDACWECIAVAIYEERTKRGVSGRKRTAQWMAYALTHGAVPSGLLVARTCGMRGRCVRPDHLFAGTPQDIAVNSAGHQRLRRGSASNNCRGERSAFAKLTPSDVAKVYARYFDEGMSTQDIARASGIARSTIGDIVSGKSWSHLYSPERATRFVELCQRNSRRGPCVLRKLSVEVAAGVRRRLAEGESQRSIAQTLGVSKRRVYEIANGISYLETATPLVARACEGASPSSPAAPAFDAWRACGLPRVGLTEQHAAARMASAFPPDLAGELRAPWPAFLIDVPGGLLDTDGCAVEHLLLDLRAGAEVWFCDREGTVREIRAESLAALAGLELAPLDDMARALALNVILEVTHHRPALAHGTGPREIARTARGEPTTTDFMLTADVKLDARRAVRDYVRGVTASLGSAVQRLVRGHPKMQPHGPRGALRKPIFVEAYWQGAADAPLALRSHVLTAEGSE